MLEATLFLAYLVVGVLMFNLLETPQHQDWWVKIITKNPHCTYYFGPFSGAREARNHCQGYVADLMEEGTQTLQVEIQRAQPHQVTILGNDV